MPLFRLSSLAATMLDKPDQKEKLLSMLLSELDGMVYLCHFDDLWTMEFVSNGCQALTGYNPEDLIKNRRLSFLDLIHPDDRDMVFLTIRNAVENRQSFTIEYRIIHSDGTERWVMERGRAVTHNEETVQLIHGFILDNSERHQHEKMLLDAEKRYRSIFENATEGIFQTTIDGQYLEVNPALATIYGYHSPADMIAALRDIGQQLYVYPGQREEFIQRMRAKGHITNFESQIFRQDGKIIWISENAHEIRNEDGELLYYEGTVEDITERKAYEELIAFQATHDALTNLPNRTLMKDRIEQAIHNANRHRRRAAIVFVDLDNFKQVNDSLGHTAGDELIKIVAERLRHCLRENDTVARLGGDEFLVILNDIQEDKEIIYTVKRILNAIEQSCLIGSREYLITCSMGISVYPEQGNNAEQLLKNADIAMYQAKQGGRNGYHLYSPELDRAKTDRLNLEQKLRLAINEQQFQLFYQPKFDIATNRITGAEALIRWYQKDEKRFIPPRAC